MRALSGFLIVGFLICAPISLSAQSTLNFPRVLGVADMPVTGYALVNPGSTSADVTFTLYATDGSVPSPTSTFKIVAGGQIAKLASELFPAAQKGGWIQATSSASGLRGFWLGGDFVTYADSAGAVTSAAEFILPIVTSQSEIDLINPDSGDEYALVRLYNSQGLEVTDPQVEALPAKGAYRQNAALLFSAGDLSQAVIAKVTCMISCAGTVLVRDFMAAPSLAVANGINTAATDTTLKFPQVVQGPLNGLNYSTLLSLTNLAASSETVTISYTPDTGARPTSVQRVLNGNATLHETPGTLFGFNAGFFSGWISVASDRPVAGIVVYAESVNGGVAVTSGQSQSANNLILAHMANLQQWQTGFALLNAGSSTASVDLFAIAPDGTLIGKSLSNLIAPGAKLARLINELIPQVLTRPSDGGFVFVRSNVPLYGMELFFTRDLQILSNVPAFGLAPTEQFTPPPANAAIVKVRP